jgi:hypothetical protein
MRKTAYRARLIFEGREATGEYRLLPALPGSLESAQRGFFKEMNDSAAVAPRGTYLRNAVGVQAAVCWKMCWTRTLFSACGPIPES